MSAIRRTAKPAESWPLYEIPRPDAASPYTSDSNRIIEDMVIVLSEHNHASTADALAFLRQVYPRYPLTLRLAALVAHAKNEPMFGQDQARLDAAE